MAFGSTLKQPQTAATTDFNTDPIFLDIRDGIRVIRILGDEVQVKTYWFDKVNVKGKIGKRPFIVAVFRDGRWQTADKGKNAIDLHYDETVTDPEKRKKLYPSQRFYVNVLDRTRIFTDKDGNVIYPNSNGDYPKGYNEEDALPRNMVAILEASGGKEGGKHFLQQISTLGDNLRSFQTGKRINLLETDIRIITKKTLDPSTGKETTVRTPMPDYDQNPLPEDLANLPLYDLEKFCKPWPNEALQEVIDGADYYETAKKYNVVLFPRKIGAVEEESNKPTEDDEPF